MYVTLFIFVTLSLNINYLFGFNKRNIKYVFKKKHREISLNFLLEKGHQALEKMSNSLKNLTITTNQIVIKN